MNSHTKVHAWFGPHTPSLSHTHTHGHIAWVAGINMKVWIVHCATSFCLYLPFLNITKGFRRVDEEGGFVQTISINLSQTLKYLKFVHVQITERKKSLLIIVFLVTVQKKYFLKHRYFSTHIYWMKWAWRNNCC